MNYLHFGFFTLGFSSDDLLRLMAEFVVIKCRALYGAKFPPLDILFFCQKEDILLVSLRWSFSSAQKLGFKLAAYICELLWNC